MSEQALVDRKVAQALSTHPALQQAVELESGVLELLTIAARQEDWAIRWYQYETLKGLGSGLVGWYAKKQALQSTTTYEAFVAALDDLLPCRPIIEEETQQ